jgi:hypothetical protein
MILDSTAGGMLNIEVGGIVDSKPRMLLKTISWCPGERPGATLGATRMNNLRMIRTRPDNRERRARGHELF